jgi:hypothetical protein
MTDAVKRYLRTAPDCLPRITAWHLLGGTADPGDPGPVAVTGGRPRQESSSDPTTAVS